MGEDLKKKEVKERSITFPDVIRRKYQVCEYIYQSGFINTLPKKYLSILRVNQKSFQIKLPARHVTNFSLVLVNSYKKKLSVYILWKQ